MTVRGTKRHCLYYIKTCIFSFDFYTIITKTKGDSSSRFIIYKGDTFDARLISKPCKQIMTSIVTKAELYWTVVIF